MKFLWGYTYVFVCHILFLVAANVEDQKLLSAIWNAAQNTLKLSGTVRNFQMATKFSLLERLEIVSKFVNNVVSAIIYFFLRREDKFNEEKV